MTADHFEYDEIDRDEYTDCEVDTHKDGEDDVGTDDRKNEDASREEPEVIAPGCGVVVKPKKDKPYVAEVLKERKATLEAARLTRDADRRLHHELVTVKRADVVYSFPMSGGGSLEVPQVAQAKLQGNRDVDAQEGSGRMSATENCAVTKPSDKK